MGAMAAAGGTESCFNNSIATVVYPTSPTSNASDESFGPRQTTQAHGRLGLLLRAMPPRCPKKPPCDYVDAWPGGAVHSDAPPEFYLVRDIVKRLKEAMEDKNKSISALARDAGTTRQTIYNLLEGKAWPELSTIAWLERALGRRIWGSAHKNSPEPVEPPTPDESPV